MLVLFSWPTVMNGMVVPFFSEVWCAVSTMKKVARHSIVRN